ncbi:2OG-Fe(II) oxygenase [Chitinimonas lacunae]|uniref:2OG-Fe(II) oxygenase n=1 Tax=Chitinimonas lacunae TaxID=1963018 RepID=A0ABV8MTX8_9NEIS
MQVNSIGAGIFTIEGFLSPEECHAYIEHSEKIGYEAALINTEQGARMLPEVRNNHRILYDDAQLADQLYQRARPYLPQDIQGWQLCGFNERLRFYRYGPGEFFKRHKDGTYIRSTTEESALTFMIYLNEDFEGGTTEFNWEVVTPRIGMALVFPHRMSHQGSQVREGLKYVLRTDVMYRDEIGHRSR